MKSGQKGPSQEQVTRTTVDNFNEIFNRPDADGLAPFLTEDTMFENTSPAPDGRRIEGKAAVIEFWRGWFMRNSDARFDAEEVIVSGSRATVPWVSQDAQRAAMAPAGALTFLPCGMER